MARMVVKVANVFSILCSSIEISVRLFLIIYTDYINDTVKEKSYSVSSGF